MDHRGAVTRNDHRARGGVQVKAVIALVLAGSVAYADPPGETPAAEPDASAQPAPPPATQPAPPVTAQPAPAPALPPDTTAPPASLKPASTSLPPAIERVDPPPHARTEAWVATGVTAAIVGMGVYSVVQMRESSSRANQIWTSNGEGKDWNAELDNHDRWFHRTLLFGGLTVASVAVTGILWSRSQPSFRAAVTPQGGYVGYARSF